MNYTHCDVKGCTAASPSTAADEWIIVKYLNYVEPPEFDVCPEHARAIRDLLPEP